MAAEAESSRLANAKIIVAKAEIEATKNLQKASDILSDNPMCMQVFSQVDLFMSLVINIQVFLPNHNI